MPESKAGKVTENLEELLFENKQVSPQFAVGLNLYYEIRQRNRRVRVKANMLGWYRPSILLTTAPTFEGRMLTAPLGTEIIVRYMLDGAVYGFITRLVQKYQDPVNVWILAYPEMIEVKNLRRSPRVQMYLQVKDESQNSWMLLDISMQGALLSVEQDSKIGDTINLNFTLPDGEKIENLKGEVVRVHHTREDHTVGVMFDETDVAQLEKIKNYVENSQTHHHRLTVPEFEISHDPATRV